MSRIVGFGDLNKDKDDRDPKENEYFTGGINPQGGGSGMAVQGRPNDSYDPILKKAVYEDPSPTNEANFTITLYQNGFIVNNGEFRPLNDPQNKEFLDALGEGRVPKEIQSQSKTKDVSVRLVDNRNKEYVPPSFSAFSGGSKLGSSSCSDGWVFRMEELVRLPTVQLDTNAPTTLLQVKSSMGPQKLKIKINQNSTVLQLAKVARDLCPEKPFKLAVGHPPKNLEDPSQTIVAAGLIGASILLLPQ